MALWSSQEIANLSLRLAFGPSTRQAGVFRRLDFARSSGPLAKRVPLHLVPRWTFDGTRSTISPPGRCGSELRFGAREGGSNSAVASAQSRSGRRDGSSAMRLGRIRRIGCDAPNINGELYPPPSPRTPQPRHNADSRSNAPCRGLFSDDCASGFDLVASLGRRRTSTVNEGTARLNVVLDTAHRSADSSSRGRPCEAKRNKAIGDYRRDKRPPGRARRPNREVAREPLKRRLLHGNVEATR